MLLVYIVYRDVHRAQSIFIRSSTLHVTSKYSKSQYCDYSLMNNSMTNVVKQSEGAMNAYLSRFYLDMRYVHTWHVKGTQHRA